MRILLVSDVHYGRKLFHGHDQSKAFDWLYGVVEGEKPDLLLSAGDFGDEASPKLFHLILESTCLFTIYGNHDNVELMQTLKNRDGSPCLLQDGLVRNYEGLKLAGISGNIVKIKRKVHHKTVEEVREVISKYAHLREVIDVLITHEAPKHELISRGKTLGNDALHDATERLRPKLYLCGHVHIPSQILKLNNTTLINLDSSTRHQEYVIAEYEEGGNCDIRIISPNVNKPHSL